MLKIKHILFLFFTPLATQALFAQTDIVDGFYQVHPTQINPAAFRNPEMTSVAIGARMQWAGMEGAPMLYNLGALSQIKNDNMALGINIARAVEGPFTGTNATALYAYRIWLNEKSLLSFALEAGIANKAFDQSGILVVSPDDPAYNGLLETMTMPDLNLGVFFKKDSYYLGLSVRHIFENKTSANNFVTGQPFYNLNMRTVYVQGGYFFPLDYGGSFILHASALGRYNSRSGLNMDINASVMMYNFISAGLSYRSLGSVMAVNAEVKFLKYFSAAYIYDMNMNKLVGTNFGSHQLAVRFDMDVFKNPNNFSKRRVYY